MKRMASIRERNGKFAVIYTSKDSEVGGNVSTSNSTQKMQILDAKNNVVDFTTLLQDNS